MTPIIIERYSHFLRMVNMNGEQKRIVKRFIKDNLVEPKLDYVDGRYVTVFGEIYATRTKDDHEWRIHANNYDQLIKFLDGWKVDYRVDDHREDIYLGDDVSFMVPDGFNLRDYQEDIVKYLHTDGCQKIVELAMGKGKTATSLYFAKEYGKRTCVMILGRYTDRWWEDLERWVGSDHIIEIRGAKGLQEAMEMSETPEWRQISLVIMTITTFTDYIKEYETVPLKDRMEMISPHEVWEVLGIGLRITDETHQHFAQNHLIDLYTHLPKTIYLSATLKPHDKFLKRMYELMLPPQCRVGFGLQDKYINCRVVLYRFRYKDRLRYNNRKRMYNHTEFEKCLLKNKQIFLDPYFKMLDELLEANFLNIRKPGQKALLFFATKAMCGQYVKHLKSRFPKVDSRRYISEDPYSDLLKSEIACSTLGSAGTAVDVPNLLTCIMTTALKSEQANLQALGRLRKLNEDTPQFLYLACEDIPKHMQYHYAKRKLFKDWVAKHGELYIPVAL